MNEVINSIQTRRSIRQFNDKPISKKDLELIVDYAIHAPSGMGKDTWYFAVVTNQDLINELIDIMKVELNNNAYTMYHPTALIIPANLKDNSHGMEDNACALENIFLASHSLNIGSVWINQLRHYMDSKNLRTFLEKVGIDDSMVVYGIAALGYYDTKPVPKIRKGKFAFFE